MAFLFLISSCALFKVQPNLTTMDKEKLLDSVKLTGEGRGRLTFAEAQYVFEVDSVLNNSQDWIMAVQIPLHGEEVMIFSDLKLVEVEKKETDSFEERIDREFKHLKFNKSITSSELLDEMRSLIRFVLSPQWGKKRSCAAQNDDLMCELDGEKYLIRTSTKEFFIKKSLGEGKSLQLVAKNLTESFFRQTDILLHLNESSPDMKGSSFSMEFFW